MSAFRFLLYGLLLVVTGYAAHLAWQTRDRSPQVLLDKAVEYMEAELPDYDAAVVSLDRALDRARVLGDLTLAQEALFQRAEVHLARGLSQLALNDFRAALAEFGARPDIIDRATRAALRAGEPEQALEFALRLREVAPDNEMGPDLVGRTRMVLAERELGGMRSLLAEALPGTVARDTFELARYAAVLDLDSSARRVALDRIRVILDDEDNFAEVAARIEGAGASLRQGREAFLDSLDVRASPEAMEAFLDLYLRADAVDMAAVLARFAGSRKRFQGGDGAVLLRTAQALLRLGRTAEAKRRIQKGRKPKFNELPASELDGWCAVLHETEQWPQLFVAARRYTRVAAGRALAEANFYLGRACIRLGKWDQVITPLRIYGRESGPELYPGARTDAWMGIALAARQLEQANEERRALAAVARLSPSRPNDPRQARDLAEAWRRRAEEQTAEGLFGPAQTSLTFVMNYAPELVPEIEPAWRLLAEAKRKEQGRTLFTAEGRPVNSGPDPSGGPEELLRFAEYHLAPVDDEEPEPAISARHANRVLRVYPQLLPALDILGRAYIAGQDEGRAADALLRQLEAGGDPNVINPRLASLDLEAMAGTYRVRWARASPATVLLAPFVDQLFEAGRPALALRALKRKHAGPRTPEVLARTGRLFAARGAWAEAYGELSRLPSESPELGRHAGLLLEAALHLPPARQKKELAIALRRIQATPIISDPGLPRVLDRLATVGQSQAALTLVEACEGSPNLWGEEVLLRGAIGSLTLGRRDACEEYIARVEALGDGVAAELGEIITAAAFEEWAPVARFARRRRAALDAETDPFHTGVFAALGGDFHGAYELLESATDETRRPNPLAILARKAVEAHLGRLARPAGDAPQPEKLQFRLLSDLLLGQPKAPRDPRTTLMWLLAVEHPAWAVWFLGVKDSLPAHLQNSPWVLYLEAQALHASGDDARAKSVLTKLSRFTPYAWLLAEEIAETVAVGPLDPQLLAARSQRIRRFGDGGLDEVERGLVRAFDLAKGKRAERAPEVLRKLVADFPSDARALTALANDASRAERLGEALDSYHRLFEVLPLDLAREHVPDYLAILSRAASAELVSPAAHRAALEALEIQFTDDPSVTRELTRLTLLTSSGGLGAAWQHFEAFRDEHSDHSIESLRTGEARRWLEVYLEYDPARAIGFIEEELERDPASMGTWFMFVEGLRRVGRKEEALELCEDLLGVVPAPELLRLQARLLVDLDRNPAGVRRILDQIDPERGKLPAAERDAELEYLEARARMKQKKRDRRWAAKRFKGLWQRRRANRDVVDPVELAPHVAMAFLVPGNDYDPEAARTVLEQAKTFTDDALELDFLRAFGRILDLEFGSEDELDVAEEEE